MAYLRRSRSVSNSGISSRSAVSTPRYSVMCALGQPAHMPVSRTSAELPSHVDQLDVAAVGLQKRPDPIRAPLRPVLLVIIAIPREVAGNGRASYAATDFRRVWRVFGGDAARRVRTIPQRRGITPQGHERLSWRRAVRA